MRAGKPAAEPKATRRLRTWPPNWLARHVVTRTGYKQRSRVERMLARHVLPHGMGEAENFLAIRRSDVAALLDGHRRRARRPAAADYVLTTIRSLMN